MNQKSRDSQGATEFDAKCKAAWLKQIGLDLALTAAALRIAITLAFTYINRSTWLAWPSLQTLARETGLRDSTTREALKLLSDRGHLAILHARGRGKVNRYRPMLQKTAAPAATFGNEKTAALAEEKPPLERKENRRQSGDRTYVIEPMEENPLPRAAREGGEKASPNSSSKKRASRASPRLSNDQLDELFETEIWPHYPKKIGKKDARKLFPAALEKAPIEVIKAGVLRAAAFWSDKPVRFAPRLANFLEDEMWNANLEELYGDHVASNGGSRPSLQSTAQVMNGVYSD